MRREIFEKAKELEVSILNRTNGLRALRNGDLHVTWDSGFLIKESKKDYAILEQIKKDLIDNFERDVNAMTVEFNALGDPSPNPKPAPVVSRM